MPNFSKKKKTVKEALWAVACATRHQPTLQWQQMAQKFISSLHKFPKTFPSIFYLKKTRNLNSQFDHSLRLLNRSPAMPLAGGGESPAN
jgi:hypothetical protein